MSMEALLMKIKLTIIIKFITGTCLSISFVIIVIVVTIE